jgi:hypothetical protein
VRDNQRDPVLSALIRLSEGKPLSPAQDDELRRSWPDFVRRTSVGYVVLDRRRATEGLRSVATTTLQLERLAEDDPLTLYRPAVSLD